MKQTKAPPLPGSPGDKKDALDAAVIRAAYIVLNVSLDTHESRRFLGILEHEDFSQPEHKICLPIDLGRLTALTHDAVCGFPRAARITRRDIKEVIFLRRDLGQLLDRIRN